MAAQYQFANNPQTTLSGAVTAGATAISVASGALFPATGKFTIIVDSEIMLVTGVAGTTWTVERGAEGTTAAAHNNNATVSGVLTRDSLVGVVEDMARAAAVRGRLVAYDEFNRYPDGDLNGLAPLIGPNWVVTGASPITIQSGRATANGASAGYAYLTLDEPVHYIESVVVFSGTEDGSEQMTMSWADSSGGLADLLHFNFGGRDFSMQIRKDSGAFVFIGTGAWEKPCAFDNVTPYKFGCYVRGNTVVVIGPNGEVFSTFDARVADLVTPTVFWEPVQLASTGRAHLLSVRAIARPAEEREIDHGPDALDLALFGASMGGGSVWDVTFGQDPSTGLPSIFFGPAAVRTVLRSDVAIGAGTIVTHEPLLAGTATIGIGSGMETVTVTGLPSPLPGAGYPYTATLSGLTTKTHAAGTTVVGAGATRKHLQYNVLDPTGMALEVDGNLNLNAVNLYRDAVKVIGARKTGWSNPTGTPTRTAFDTGTVTTAQLAERVKALIDDLIDHGLIGA